MNGHQETPLKGSSELQRSQHQAGRAALSFFDLGTGVLPESGEETALELWWAELTDLGPAGWTTESYLLIT